MIYSWFSLIKRDLWKLIIWLVFLMLIPYLPHLTAWLAVQVHWGGKTMAWILMGETWAIELIRWTMLGVLPYWAAGERITRQNSRPLIMWVGAIVGIKIFSILAGALPGEMWLSVRNVLFEPSSFCWVYFGVCVSVFGQGISLLILLCFLPVMWAIWNKCSFGKALSMTGSRMGKVFLFASLLVVGMCGNIVLRLIQMHPNIFVLKQWFWVCESLLMIGVVYGFRINEYPGGKTSLPADMPPSVPGEK